MPPKGRKRANEKALPGSMPDVDDATRLALAVEKLTAITLARACDRVQTSYADFCDQVFGLKLTEAQRAVTDVIFDGKKPDPRYAKEIFGGMVDTRHRRSRWTRRSWPQAEAAASRSHLLPPVAYMPPSPFRCLPWAPASPRLSLS